MYHPYSNAPASPWPMAGQADHHHHRGPQTPWGDAYVPTKPYGVGVGVRPPRPAYPYVAGPYGRRQPPLWCPVGNSWKVGRYATRDVTIDAFPGPRFYPERLCHHNVILLFYEPSGLKLLYLLCMISP